MNIARTVMTSVVLAALLVGCGPSARSAPDVEPVCGGEGVRLAAALFPTGMVAAGQQLQFENGAAFLYVEASCDVYYSTWSPPWSPQPGIIKTTRLSSAQANALSTDLHFAEWSDLAGYWDPQVPVFDAGIWVFSNSLDSARTATCNRACAEGGDAPGALSEAAVAAREWIETLWTEGEPLSGGVRYVLVQTDRSLEPWLEWGDPWVWPITSVEPQAVSITETEAYDLASGSGRFAYGRDAESLRNIRSEFGESVFYKNFSAPCPVVRDANGVLYRLWMRDALPFEDERGLVRPR